MGAPVGNKNAAKAKRWQQAIFRALARATSADIDSGLDQAADKLVALAFSGDKWAIDHLADRTDGKPAQAITGDAEGDPIRTVSEVILRAVDAAHSRPASESS